MFFTTFVLQDLPQRYILLHFFKLLRFFYLFRMLVEFSVTCIFQHVWETFFNLWCSHSQKIIKSMLFYLCPTPPLITPGGIFWKSVSSKIVGVEEAMICSIKIQWENLTMTWSISLFPFGMIAIFLNVMALATNL